MGSETAKLPFWATVKSAYRLAWNHRAEFVKISRYWLILSIPVLLLYNLVTWSSVQTRLCLNEQLSSGVNLPPEALYHALSKDLLISLPPSLFLVLLGASIAVAWHRLILRGERIATPRYLRFDNIVENYFIFGAILCFLPLLSFLFMPYQFGSVVLGLALMVISFLVIALIVTRLALILPAKALDVQEITVKDVWEKTRGNFWRLFIGGVLCALPAILIGVILQPHCSDSFVNVVLYTVNALAYPVIVAPIALSFLSLAYQHFFEKSELFVRSAASSQ